MKKLYVTRGLPASGKSTWALNQAEVFKDTVIINRDKIRDMLKGSYKFFPFGSRMEELVTEIEDRAIDKALMMNYNVIVDATNFRWTEDKLYHYESKFQCKAEFVDFTHLSLKTCIQRDQQRENSVGKKVIERMYNKYLKKDEKV